jgi:hypothetical protein
MGIPELLAAAMKRIPWGQVADVAMQRGPDLIRKLKERLQTPPALEIETTAGMAQLGERILELERTVVRQADIIQGQNKKTELLEDICKTLQARLQLSLAISMVAALLSLVLLILMLRK